MSLQNWPYLNISDRITSRQINVGSLSMHIVESFPQDIRRSPDLQAGGQPPLILLLHGFPELSFSWRHLLIALSSAGFYAVAPDQRGYGLTCAERPTYDDDLAPYMPSQLVSDVRALISALGYERTSAIIAHDAGSRVAGFAVLSDPSIARALVIMSTPFTGAAIASTDIDAKFAGLNPPKMHYTAYYSSRHANEDMFNASEGLFTFLRTYFHVKSAGWPENDKAKQLPSADAEALAAHLPPYYLLPVGRSMLDTLRPHAPTSEQIERLHQWLPAEELDVYVSQYARTGFQGGMNWYRAVRTPEFRAWRATLPAKVPDTVRMMYVGGEKDWGVWQTHGAVARMRATFEGMRPGIRRVGAHGEDGDPGAGLVLVRGAGHWVQQEKPREVENVVLSFLAEAGLLPKSPTQLSE